MTITEIFLVMNTVLLLAVTWKLHTLDIVMFKFMEDSE